MAESLELTADECRRLLLGGVIGRVAIATSTGPHIVPVNYSVVDDTVVFRTTPYSVLGTEGRDAQMAFEVDHFDYANQQGWSVVAHGPGEVVESEEIQHIREVWSPRPWANGVRNVFFRLHWRTLTGRRLGAGWTPKNEAPVHRTLSGALEPDRR